MNLIVSVDKNWGIGKDNKLLFSVKGDMEFFKEKTTGKAVIMGRKTLDSLPGGQPLKNRVNIVLTRDTSFKRDGVIVCHSVDEALEKTKAYPDAFVIGGGEIYKLFLPYCATAYVTKIPRSANAEVFMVNLDEREDWEMIKSTDFSEYSVCEYKKKITADGGQQCIL